MGGGAGSVAATCTVAGCVYGGGGSGRLADSRYDEIWSQVPAPMNATANPHKPTIHSGLGRRGSSVHEVSIARVSPTDRTCDSGSAVVVPPRRSEATNALARPAGRAGSRISGTGRS